MSFPLRLERFLARHSILDRSVVHRHSDRTVQRWLEDPEFPVLISFPRTGSHQLRYLMELYFREPSLPRIFHYKRAKSFTCCHMHDLDPPDRLAGIERERAIVLYRDPVPTVHSVMTYYGEDETDLERIRHWSSLYRRHLEKWCLDEVFTEEKVILSYEELQTDPRSAFQRICSFFGKEWEPERFDTVQGLSSPERIGERTSDNPAIIGARDERKERRKRFVQRAGPTIEKAIYEERPELRSLFPGKSS